MLTLGMNYGALFTRHLSRIYRSSLLTYSIFQRFSLSSWFRFRCLNVVGSSNVIRSPSSSGPLTRNCTRTQIELHSALIQDEFSETQYSKLSEFKMHEHQKEE